MSIISKRKKVYIKSGLIGGLVMLGIILIIISVLFFSPLKLIFFKESNNSNNKTIVYKLTRDVNSNEMLRSSDIEPVEIIIAQNSEFINMESPVGKHVMLSMEKGTVLSDVVLCQENSITNDTRVHNYPYVKIHNKLTKGCYIDIRISFPNGADYIVMSAKQVKDYSLYNQEEGKENSLWLEVSEEEILRMSSAVMDTYSVEGSYIYAVKYINEAQDKAKVTYPVNETVRKIIESNPNIVNKSKSILEMSSRNLIEENNNRGNEDISSYEETYDEESNSIKDNLSEESTIQEIEYLD